MTYIQEIENAIADFEVVIKKHKNALDDAFAMNSATDLIFLMKEEIERVESEEVESEYEAERLGKKQLGLK